MLWMTVIPWISTMMITYLSITNESWINGFTTDAWAIFFLCSILTMGLAVTPTTFISLISGYFLGWQAALPVVLCYQLAALMGFGLAQQLDAHTLDWVINKFPKSATVFENVERKQWQTTFLARISPALPFGLMNVVLAVSGIRLVPFFLGGLVGMLPRTLFFIWLGIKAPILVEALQTKGPLAWFVVLSVAGIFVLYKMLTAKR